MYIYQRRKGEENVEESTLFDLKLTTNGLTKWNKSSLFITNA